MCSQSISWGVKGTSGGIVIAAVALQGWFGATLAQPSESYGGIDGLPAACIRRAAYGRRCGEPYIEAGTARMPNDVGLTDILLNGDGTAAALVDRQVGVVHWLLNAPALTYYYEAAAEPWSASFAEEDKLLAVGMSNTLIHIVDATNGKNKTRLGRPGEHAIRFVKFIGEGRYLAATRGSIFLASVAKPESYAFREDDESAYYRSFAYTGAWLAAADTANRKICLWHCADERPKKRVLGGQADTVNALAVTPDGRTIVVGHGNPSGTIQFVDVSSGRVARTVRLAPGPDVFTRPDRVEAPTVGVSSLACSPDGKFLVSGGYNGSVRMWEVGTGDEVSEFKGHDREVVAMGFAADGKTLATADYQGNIQVWDPRLHVRGGQIEPTDLTTNDLETGWETITNNRDHTKAYRVIWRFVAGVRQSVPFLKKELRPLPGDDPTRIAELVENLGNDRFPVRESASRELAKLADLAEPQLRRLLQGQPNQEAKQRAEKLLADMGRSPLLQRLRWGVAILRVSKHPESGEILKSLVRRYPGTWLAQEAEAALRLMTN